MGHHVCLMRREKVEHNVLLTRLALKQLLASCCCFFFPFRVCLRCQGRSWRVEILSVMEQCFHPLMAKAIPTSWLCSSTLSSIRTTPSHREWMNDQFSVWWSVVTFSVTSYSKVHLHSIPQWNQVFLKLLQPNLYFGIKIAWFCYF